MKSILAFAILAAVMYVCGIGEKQSETTPSNTATAQAKSTPDKQALLNELMQLEKDITDAAIRGDITLLANRTTDDFQITNFDGKVQTKNEALADVKKESNIKDVLISDGELLSFSEDSAVLKYIEVVRGKNGAQAKVSVTDSFVKKDGKWLAKSEQQTMIKLTR
ncbi:MAG: nuclear transport factor 2 family protein [Acidobacteriota bacterium]